MKTLAFLILLPLAVTNASKCSHKTKPADSSSSATTTTTTTTNTGTTGPVSNGAATTVDTTVGGTTGNTQTADTYRFIVSFASRGTGIDYKTKEEFMKWIEEFRPVVKAEEYHWGREGEVDVCLKLSELSTKDQERFVKEARIKLGSKDLIFVEENAACRHKR